MAKQPNLLSHSKNILPIHLNVTSDISQYRNKDGTKRNQKMDSLERELEHTRYYYTFWDTHWLYCTSRQNRLIRLKHLIPNIKFVTALYFLLHCIKWVQHTADTTDWQQLSQPRLSVVHFVSGFITAVYRIFALINAVVVSFLLHFYTNSC